MKTTSLPPLTGLFLGAGASCEVGMPLVWDLTAELIGWLTPDKLRSLNEGWRTQGGGHADEVIEDVAKILAMPNVHYESVLGYIETQFRRYRPTRIQQDYHGLYSWLVEMVYHILYYRHVRNVEYIDRTIKYLDGIAFLAANNRPLWVFSLNHDAIIECVIARHGIPLSAGFSPEVVTLPRRDAHGIKCGELRAEVISASQIEKCALRFLEFGARGVNLLKIHGALDMFTFRDGKDLLRVLPEEPSVSGIIGALRAANEELLYAADCPGGKLKVTNEIAYADEGGEMQFLRRSLLAGAYKFDSKRDQVLPRQLLDCFRSNVNWVTNLICIGYGFGDVHINQVLREWLEFSADRRLELVAPGIALPPFLQHLTPQVVLVDATATVYLDKLAGITRSRREQVEKRLAAWQRSRKRTESEAELIAFMREYQLKVARMIGERMARLPIRDGDIDEKALSVSQDELTAQLLSDLPINVEDMLEEFLSSRNAGPISPTPLVSRERIAEEAYFRWLNRGAKHGHDVDDWLAAESTLRS